MQDLSRNFKIAGVKRDALKSDMKNNAYMPVCLDLSGERCLVVGGGNVALRKIGVLREFGANITCLSPELVRGLEEAADKGEIKHLKRKYSLRVALKSYKLVIAATNDPKVNARIAGRGRDERVLVNVVDGGCRGDVIMPAILKRNGLTIGISTGGASPARAKKVRDIISDAV